MNRVVPSQRLVRDRIFGEGMRTTNSCFGKVQRYFQDRRCAVMFRNVRNEPVFVDLSKESEVKNVGPANKL